MITFSPLLPAATFPPDRNAFCKIKTDEPSIDFGGTFVVDSLLTRGPFISVVDDQLGNLN